MVEIEMKILRKDQKEMLETKKNEQHILWLIRTQLKESVSELQNKSIES